MEVFVWLSGALAYIGLGYFWARCRRLERQNDEQFGTVQRLAIGIILMVSSRNRDEGGLPPNPKHALTFCRYQPPDVVLSLALEAADSEIGIAKRVGAKYCGLPQDVYEHGLPDAQAEAWERLLEKKGRIPWIQYPNLCCRCGARWPDMFKVPDKEWERYVEPAMRHEMLCRTCYDWVKHRIDSHEKGSS